MRITCALYLTYCLSLTSAAPAGPAHSCPKLDYISRQESDQLLAGLRSEDTSSPAPNSYPASDELKKRQSSPNEGLPGLNAVSSIRVTREGFGAVENRHSGTLNERLWQGSFSDASVYAAQRTGEASARASRGLCKFFKVCGAGIANSGAEVFRRIFTMNLDIADRDTLEGRREINKIALANFVTFATILAIFSGTLYTLEKDYRHRTNATTGKRAGSPKSQAINFKIDFRDGLQPKNPIAVIRQFVPGSAPLDKLEVQTSYLDNSGEYTFRDGKKVPVSEAANTSHNKADARPRPPQSRPPGQPLPKAPEPPTKRPGPPPPKPPGPPPPKRPGPLQKPPGPPRKPPKSSQPESPKRSTGTSNVEVVEDPPEAEELRRDSLTAASGTILRRDLRGASNCAPTTQWDYYKLLKHVWLAVILPSLESGESAIQVLLAGPNSGSEYLLVNGGDMSLTVWVTEQPDKEILLAKDPLSLTQLKSQDPKPLKRAECYAGGTPKDAYAKVYGPSLSWWGKFFDICAVAFGSKTAKVVPRDFLYAGQPHDPEEKGYGAGWYGRFIANGCKRKYSCEDLLGADATGQQADPWELIHQCLPKTPDHTFHGGVYWHQVPANGGKGTTACGFIELQPLSDYMDS